MIIHALPRATRGSDNSQCQFMRLHAPTWISHALNTPTRYMRHALTRAFSTTMSCMTSSSIPRSDPFVQLTRFDQDQPENLTQSKLLEIIFKKKVREKNALTKWTFDFDQKVKIFKRGLSHSIFRVHSNFGICFFAQDSKIVQTIQIPKSWLLDKSWPKSQKFQEGLILPNFSRRFWFLSLFLHLRIQNCSKSVILQLLALMWTLTKNQEVQAKLVLFRLSYRF